MTFWRRSLSRIDGDRASTAALFLLVAVSLVLSGTLWFQPGGDLESAQPGLRVPVKEHPSPDQMVLPRQIVVHSGTEGHELLLPGQPGFNQTWAAAEQVLAHMDLTEDTTLAPQDLADLSRGQSLDVVFPAALPLSDWLWVWRGTVGQQVWPSTRHMVISLGSPSQAFVQVDGEDRWVRASLSVGLAPLTAALKDQSRFQAPVAQQLPTRVHTLEVVPGIWVPADGYQVATAHVTDDPLKPDALVRSFFADMSVVRRIVERDGTVMYTDGVQLLRVYPNGRVEYSRPEPADQAGSASFSDSLDEALAFVAVHGGWLVDTAVVQASQDQSANHLGFGLEFAGLPIVEQQPPLQVSLNAHGVIALRRAMEPPQGPADSPATAISATRALDLAAASRNNRPGRVTDMYLAYVRTTGRVLRPAWIVALDSGETLAVDASTGHMLTIP